MQVAGSALTNNGGTITAALSGGINDGDLLLALLGDAKGSQENWNQPTGWPTSPDLDVASGHNSSDMRALVNHRTAANDSGATYQWTTSPWTNLVLGVLEYAGVDTTNPYDATPTSATKTTTAPSLTTDIPGATLVYVLIVSGSTNTITTAPAGFTKRFETSGTTLLNAPHIYVYDTTQTSPGPTGAITATVTGTTSNAVALLFALRPAAGGSATVPGAPTNVVASAGNGQASVSWAAPVSDGGSAISGYTVTASPGGASATVNGSTTTTTISGLTNGTAYTFTVHATNTIGNSPESAPSNAVTPSAPATVPGAPTNVVASAGNGQASVSWAAPVSNGGSAITGYTVTSTPGNITATVNGSTTTTTISGLTNGTAYTFTVHATNTIGNSPESAPSNAVTPTAATTIPGAPTNVTATAGDTQASISWSPPASNGGSAITGYTVTASPGGATATTINGSTTSASIGGLTNGTAYTFTVHATNTIGNSPESAPSNTVTPTTATTIPGPPTNVTATAGDTQASISWSPPASNGGSPITGYTVTASPGGATATTINGSTTSATIGGLTNGTAYTFTVHATNTIGNSPESAPSNTVTPTAATTIPGAPTNVTATAGDTQASISWTAPTSNGGSAITGYTVTASPGGTTATVNGSTTTTISGLTNGTTYTFTVHATNTIGNSPESTPSNTVTPAPAGATVVPTSPIDPGLVLPQQISTDPYTGSGAQHATEVESAAFSWGNTTVTAFQVGRYSGGGSAENMGWATSLDGGASWQSGMVAGVTTAGGGTWPRTVDQSVSYDSVHGQWMIATLGVGLIGSSYVEQQLYVIRSSDGITWSAPVSVIATGEPDKSWLTCDNQPASPYKGTCYALWQQTTANEAFRLSKSTDGGITWSAPIGTPTSVAGYNVQPVVEPNGTLVVVATDFTEKHMLAFRSTDGGATLTDPVTFATVQKHVPTSMRYHAKPTVGVGADGVVYTVWADCRFRAGCASNDLVLTTSTDAGATWSTITRIALDPATSTVDRFLPALAVDANTSGSTTKLSLLYHYYPVAACGGSGQPTCQLNVGVVTSSDAGLTWTGPTTMTPTPEDPSWLPTSIGQMVGDYFGATFNNGNTLVFFPIAQPKPTGSTFQQSMYAATVGPDTLAVGDTSVVEPSTGNQTYALFQVQLSAVQSSTVTANFATADGTATAAAGDYVSTGGTLTIPAGSQAVLVRVPVNGNGTAPGKTFSLQLTNVVGATLARLSGKATITASATVPGAPTNVVASAGNGQASVSWAAPVSDGGSAISGYTVTASPGGASATVNGSTTTTTISGLTNGTAYTFTVHATNTIGNSPESAPSNAVTPSAPATVPGAPTNVVASAGNGQASVSWAAPVSNGGSAITGYTVTSTPGNITATVNGSTTTTTISGLTNGTAYTFTVHATNTIGNSPESAPSNAVTPTAATTIPGAPTSVTATAGDTQASISWSPPASNGGSAITGYTVTASPGGATATTINGSTTSASIGGLTNGTAYTFTVHATNTLGNSPESTPSNTVTPSAGATGSISFVQVAGSALTNNGGTITAALSGGINDGDLLLALLGDAKGSQENWNQPTGWPTSPDLDVASGHNSSDMRALVNHRTAANDSGATYQWTTSPWTNLVLGVLEYAGVDTTNPYDATPTSATKTTTAPSLTTDIPGTTLVYVLIVSGSTNTITTAPAGFTKRFETSGTTLLNAPHIYVYDTTQTSPGPTGAITATVTGTTSNAVALLFALRPAAGGSATVPGAPTNVVASAGNGQASVSWAAPVSDGGSAITGYTVTASPGGASATVNGSTTTTTISGLTNGTAYTFTVHATNTIGNSPESAPSNAVTPTAPATVPGAPTNVVASAGNGQASVSWAAPVSNGGSAITGYTVTSTPGNITATVNGSTTTTTISGLTNGTAYTFTVHATNTIGNSPESAPSNAVTPTAATTIPGAPTSVTATAGDTQASISWTPAGLQRRIGDHRLHRHRQPRRGDRNNHQRFDHECQHRRVDQRHRLHLHRARHQHPRQQPRIHPVQHGHPKRRGDGVDFVCAGGRVGVDEQRWHDHCGVVGWYQRRGSAVGVVG